MPRATYHQRKALKVLRAEQEAERRRLAEEQGGEHDDSPRVMPNVLPLVAALVETWDTWWDLRPDMHPTLEIVSGTERYWKAYFTTRLDQGQRLSPAPDPAG